MQRREDWTARLNAVIESAREKLFKWGQHDCCLFVADCIQEMTDEDVAAEVRGRYTTEGGANRLLRRLGGIEVFVDTIFNASPAVAARRGDVVLLDVQGSPLGIIDLSGRRVAAVGPNGLQFLPLILVKKAWKV